MYWKHQDPEKSSPEGGLPMENHLMHCEHPPPGLKMWFLVCVWLENIKILKGFSPRGGLPYTMDSFRRPAGIEICNFKSIFDLKTSRSQKKNLTTGYLSGITLVGEQSLTTRWEGSTMFDFTSFLTYTSCFRLKNKTLTSLPIYQDKWLTPVMNDNNS